MIRLVCFASMLSFVAIPAAAQNMAEVSLAAATGSVAGAAGKPISDSLDKIFGKVNAQTKSAAAPRRQENSSGTRAPAAVPALSETSVRSRNRGRQSRSRLHYAAPPPAADQATAAAPVPPPRPLPTLEQIAAVAQGTGRADVLSRLGAPAARLSIPDSGQLLEVYQYVDRGGNLGSVRLRDGRVSEVRVDHQTN
ncbi:MAG: hypothetical protein M1541_00560 [Acidobacteria bacterium]|nr:hypothetical protein [Acidobacteriota bacterium]